MSTRESFSACPQAPQSRPSRSLRLRCGLTGCSDTSALPMEKDLSGTSELTDLLHVVGGLISNSLPVVKAPRKGLRASLSALLTPQQREPLP